MAGLVRRVLLGHLTPLRPGSQFGGFLYRRRVRLTRTRFTFPPTKSAIVRSLKSREFVHVGCSIALRLWFNSLKSPSSTALTRIFGNTSSLFAGFCPCTGKAMQAHTIAPVKSSLIPTSRLMSMQSEMHYTKFGAGGLCDDRLSSFS
jgi:hypothetical protein